MIRTGVLLSCVLSLAPFGAEGQGRPEPRAEVLDLMEEVRQHVVVITEAPDEVVGHLYRMERVARKWRQVGGPMEVVVGRNGIGPKGEGDGRSPQGVFALGRSFGYAAEPPPGLSLPYEAQSPGAVCVDDAGSAHYNRVFDADRMSTPPDWSSAEAMRRDLAHGDDLYKWGIIVRHNPHGEPGAGSCIFLHVWRTPESPTSGCTAMAEGDLLRLLVWLTPGTDCSEGQTANGALSCHGNSGGGPILIQGTRAFLEGLRETGILPYPVPGPGAESAELP